MSTPAILTATIPSSNVGFNLTDATYDTDSVSNNYTYSTFTWTPNSVLLLKGVSAGSVSAIFGPITSVSQYNGAVVNAPMTVGSGKLKVFRFDSQFKQDDGNVRIVGNDDPGTVSALALHL